MLSECQDYPGNKIRQWHNIKKMNKERKKRKINYTKVLKILASQI